MRVLFREHQLPLVVAERHQRAVVIEVEELLARTRGVAGEGVGDIVAVEMHFPPLSKWRAAQPVFNE